MSKPTFEQSLERFLNGSLSNSDADQLAQAAVDSEVASTLVAQRSVDQLLRLIASGNQPDDFVSGCVDEFRKQVSDEVKIEPNPVAAERAPIYSGKLMAMAASIAIVGLGIWWFLPDNSVENELPGIAVSVPNTQDTDIASAKSLIELTTEPDGFPDPERSPKVLVPIEPNDRPTNVADTTTEIEHVSEAKLATTKPNLNETEKEVDQPNVGEVKAEEVASDSSFASDSGFTFGRVLSNRSTVWKNGARSNLVKGNYRLLEGSARMILDNGILLRMAGPAEFEMLDENSINVLEGELFVDIPRKTKRFSCQLGTQKILNPRNASFFLKVAQDAEGALWESLLTRGSVDLATQEESDHLIELSKKGLSQVAVAPQVPTKDIPMTLIARGKGLFMGQCLDGSESMTFKSPENLQHFVSRVVEDENIGWNRFCKNIDVFRSQMDGHEAEATPQQFRDLLGSHLKTHFGENLSPFNSDGNQTSATGFRGSLNINGVVRHFDSLEEFNRAKRILEQGGKLPPATVSTSNPTQGFTIGERKIEFSTLEMFNQSRRKMNQ